jgi:dTDP-4-amino-4,6-dideoxygalactose transaminase
MIPITKTKLPDLNRFNHYIERVWKNGIVTNGGELVKELELKLAQYLGVEHVSLVTNGTLALMIALKAIGSKKNSNIITTPFTYVATTAAIKWAGHNIKFVDIKADDFNIDESFIEKQIDEDTVGIMPVHVYGLPCNTSKISEIAKKYNLKVVYDASHCFGVFKTDPYSEFFTTGDYSVISLHATKVLGTGEGGLIISKTLEDKKKIDLIRSFGLEGDQVVSEDGTNAKMTELQAAFGLSCLEMVHHNINKRQQIYRRYKHRLEGKVSIHDLEYKGVTNNYLYFPILVNDAAKLKEQLFKKGVTVRRYFYPSLNKAYKETSSIVMPVAEKISSEILCLPIYPELTFSQVDFICDKIFEIEDEASDYR